MACSAAKAFALSLLEARSCVSCDGCIPLTGKVICDARYEPAGELAAGSDWWVVDVFSVRVLLIKKKETCLCCNFSTEPRVAPSATSCSLHEFSGISASTPIVLTSGVAARLYSVFALWSFRFAEVHVLASLFDSAVLRKGVSNLCPRGGPWGFTGGGLTTTSLLPPPSSLPP